MNHMIKKKKIAFAIDNRFVLHVIDPSRLYDSDRGLTGSEISMIKYAEGFAARGHDVTIFGRFVKNHESNNVRFIKFEEIVHYVSENWDVVIAFITPHILKAFSRCDLKVFNQQVNDFRYCQGWEEYVDLAVAPSARHRDYLKTLSNFNNWHVVPNGVDPSQYVTTEKIPGKMIYMSSPDRGLHWLLEAYPEIKRRVPYASLDIFYDWDKFYDAVKFDSTETAFRLRYIQSATEKLSKHGVVHHKCISRIRMAKELSKATALAYPVDTLGFTEGFSVSILEAATAGCLPVIVGADALESVYTGYVPCIKSPYIEHKQEWIDEVCKVLSDESYRESWKNKAKLLSVIYAWDNLVSQFADLLGL